MVRIEFLGAWKDEDVQAVRDVTVTGIEKNLKISVLPAYFEEDIGNPVNSSCFGYLNTPGWERPDVQIRTAVAETA